MGIRASRRNAGSKEEGGVMKIPGEGYRLVDTHNEDLLPTDEYYNIRGKRWKPIDSVSISKMNTFRRKVEPIQSESILDIAKRLVTGDRQNQYGPPDQDFTRTAGMMNALFADLLKEGHKFESFHIAQMMILIKLSRQLHQRKEDNWIDIAGYAYCGAICDKINSSQENK
jgi:hypothetical protein